MTSVFASFWAFSRSPAENQITSQPALSSVLVRPEPMPVLASLNRPIVLASAHVASAMHASMSAALAANLPNLVMFSPSFVFSNSIAFCRRRHRSAYHASLDRNHKPVAVEFLPHPR